MQDDTSQTNISSHPDSDEKDFPLIDGRAKKSEIFAAYKEVMKKYEENASNVQSKKQEVRKGKDDEIVRKASQFTIEKIIQDSSSLETNIRKALDDLTEKLIIEVKKLEEIREAIGIEKNSLEEIHDIKTAANTLSELIQIHESKKQELEKKFEQQKEDLERIVSERKEQWKREEESYNYKIQQERKKDKDDYEARKFALEKELKERVQNISKQEELLKDVSERAANFDQELEEAINASIEETEVKILKEEKNKADLLAERVLREKELSGLKISSFSKKIEEQQLDIVTLKQQLNDANREAKDIAVKVIEGASGVKALQNVNKIAMEQARGGQHDT